MYILENITMAEFKKHLKKTKTLILPFGTIEEPLPWTQILFIIQEALKLAAKKRNSFLASGCVSIKPSVLIWDEELNLVTMETAKLSKATVAVVGGNSKR